MTNLLLMSILPEPKKLLIKVSDQKYSLHFKPRLSTSKSVLKSSIAPLVLKKTQTASSSSGSRDLVLLSRVRYEEVVLLRCLPIFWVSQLQPWKTKSLSFFFSQENQISPLIVYPKRVVVEYSAFQYYFSEYSSYQFSQWIQVSQLSAVQARSSICSLMSFLISMQQPKSQGIQFQKESVGSQQSQSVPRFSTSNRFSSSSSAILSLIFNYYTFSQPKQTEILHIGSLHFAEFSYLR